MKQTASVISTYTSDVSGVCSALYELGGMTVMHDPSGCNSTYNTHDEPRWYDMDSMVFISGLSEMEAIMGDDDKLIDDIVEAAGSLAPRFITIAGTIVPTMIGTDFQAIAAIVQKRTGIPTYFIQTNSMQSYPVGAGLALEMVAKHMVDAPTGSAASDRLRVNLLGVTPIDFSVNGSHKSLKKVLEQHDLEVISTWAMGSSLDEIRRSAQADVNIVVTSSGLPAAKELRRRFGTPYVIGQPIGTAMTEQLIKDIRQMATEQAVSEQATSMQRMNTYLELEHVTSALSDCYDITLIGETVTMESLAAALRKDTGKRIQVLSPLDPEPELLGRDSTPARDEEELIPLLASTKMIIADPMYQPICPKDSIFVPLAHEGFSGRIYRREIPNLIQNYSDFLSVIVLNLQ